MLFHCFLYSFQNQDSISFFHPRLDRLLSLLSSGDSPAVKRSAATQIGQVASTNPKEVELILNKVINSIRTNIIEKPIVDF